MSKRVQGLKPLASTLQEVPREQWPRRSDARAPDRLLQSRQFLVQVFYEDKAVRLSVNRLSTTAGGNWKDGISWDELQQIKAQCGYCEALALEVYPEDSELVNDANMRHLFIPQVRPGFAWTRSNRHA